MLRILHYFFTVLVFVFTLDCFNSIPEIDLLTNEYVLQLDPRNLHFVEDVGRKYNLTFLRKLLSDTYLFVKSDQPARFNRGNYTWKMDDFRATVGNKVTSLEQQKLRKFSQPEVKKMIWKAFVPYPDVQNRDYYGMGVEEVWNMGYTGKNVKVAIVDIGVEMSHIELYPNMNMTLSYCFVDNNYNANPPIHTNYADTVDIDHGSKCAGLVAGVKHNHFCSAGVAPDAKLASIRFMDEDGSSTEARLVSALRHENSNIDIYSSSWALPEFPFADVGPNFQRTLLEGVEKGRNRKGSIFVFPAGNYQIQGNCNADGYVNSIYGITISRVGIKGSKPDYIPVCSCVLASTLGEGNMMTSNLLFTAGRNNTCAGDFHMTSASAALASGIIALTLEANPLLTWRDVQHIVVETTSVTGLESSGDWMINGARKRVSPYFGFGLMNATAMVQAAKSWSAVGPKAICRSILISLREIQNLSQGFAEATWSKDSDGCNGTDTHVAILEHAQVNISFEHGNITGMEIYLKSPMSLHRLPSPLLTDTTSYHSASQRLSWVFTTVHFWGEDPVGVWVLWMKYKTTASFNTTFVTAELILHGTNSMYSLSNQRKYEDTPVNSSTVAMIIHSNGMSTSATITGATQIGGNNPSGVIQQVIIPIAVAIVIVISVIAFLKRKRIARQCSRRNVNSTKRSSLRVSYHNVEKSNIDERSQSLISGEEIDTYERSQIY